MTSRSKHLVLAPITQLFPIAIARRRFHFSYAIPLMGQNAIAKLSNNQLPILMLDQCDRKFTVGWVDDLGNDTIIGASGNDSLISGAGEDLFVLGSATGVDAIADFQVGQDRLGLSGGLRFEQLAIAQGTGISSRDTFVRIAANQELLTVLSYVPASFITDSAFTFVGT